MVIDILYKNKDGEIHVMHLNTKGDEILEIKIESNEREEPEIEMNGYKMKKLRDTGHSC
jgi:hypothetical protein